MWGSTAARVELMSSHRDTQPLSAAGGQDGQSGAMGSSWGSGTRGPPSRKKSSCGYCTVAGSSRAAEDRGTQSWCSMMAT